MQESVQLWILNVCAVILFKVSVKFKANIIFRSLEKIQILFLFCFFIYLAEYYDNGHCHACHSTCETCNGPTESDCLTCASPLLRKNNKCVSTCEDGYYMEAGICAKCLHTCTQCVSRMNCTACAKGLQLQSGECRTTCAEG